MIVIASDLHHDPDLHAGTRSLVFLVAREKATYGMFSAIASGMAWLDVLPDKANSFVTILQPRGLRPYDIPIQVYEHWNGKSDLLQEMTVVPFKKVPDSHDRIYLKIKQEMGNRSEVRVSFKGILDHPRVHDCIEAQLKAYFSNENRTLQQKISTPSQPRIDQYQ
jgi:hypothetical protein